MISIIIPAHNEEAVIGRCLTHLTKGADMDELDIIVVCNGCTDNTAEIARSCAYPLRIVETEIASKCHALNLGDSLAKTFPRVYLDADIVIEIDAIRETEKVLTTSPILAAAPTMRVDLSRSSWVVRAYYDVWLRLPYCTEEMVGSGVYALSERGRRRFDKFPDVFAEDTYVCALFREGERQAVKTAEFIMSPPRSLRSIITINARRRIGYRELVSQYPQLTAGQRSRQRAELLKLARRPVTWPALGVYCLTKLATVLAHYWRYERRRVRTWHRDLSSRDSRTDN